MVYIYVNYMCPGETVQLRETCVFDPGYDAVREPHGNSLMMYDILRAFLQSLSRQMNCSLADRLPFDISRLMTARLFVWGRLITGQTKDPLDSSALMESSSCPSTTVTLSKENASGERSPMSLARPVSTHACTSFLACGVMARRGYSVMPWPGSKLVFPAPVEGS